MATDYDAPRLREGDEDKPPGAVEPVAAFAAEEGRHEPGREPRSENPPDRSQGHQEFGDAGQGEADAESGFLLDGYPRTVGQVEYLDGLLAEQGTGIDAVIRLVADQDALVGRLLKRAEQQGRSDDNEETIRRRQHVYVEQTAPIVDAYQQRGLVVEVDGLGGIDQVGDRIQSALASRGLTAGV